MSTNEFPTPEHLRQKLCDHLSENPQTYMEFLASEGNSCQNEKQRIYTEQINYLRKEGHWSNDLADAMPLDIANLLGKTLKIYCSNTANPVYEIQLYLSPNEREGKGAINLALLQIPGFEHYDACTNLEDREHLQETPPVETSLQDTRRVTPPSLSSSTLETFETVQITPRKQACYVSPIKINRKRKSV
ncbi:hypothetical protein DPMN_135187 [Dreissena polymorpha]|uniref:Uncharacterized protein n=1 Tax=Dreissena polymorpha TaxID=45954 RepID=A0A9D4FX41_DREPO|nr:hypothetical protein DPMN_135187 [Dreissena polymorpha]